MYYITRTADLKDWDAWAVGEEVDWIRLEHVDFDTEDSAKAYIKELQRLDKKNGVVYRYAINKE